jgi:hypothetical protein
LADGRQASSQNRKRWALAVRILPFVFLALVAALLASRIRAIEWSKVVEALQAYQGSTLLAAAACGLASFLVYSCFDLIGRAYTQHKLPVPQAMAVAAISYAFNLNFGTLVGGMGFRFRLYTRLGLDPITIARVLGLSVTTNWLGYLCLAGTFLLARLVPVPATWSFGAGALQAVGVIFLGIAAAYLVLCAFAHRRIWKIRGHEIALPSLRMALVQLTLSCLNWLLISSVVFTLLQPHGVGFADAMAVLLTSAVAAIIVRVPAGLGVIEAVFISLLGAEIPAAILIAALLAYRAIYYLVPVMLALVAYLGFELTAKRNTASRS